MSNDKIKDLLGTEVRKGNPFRGIYVNPNPQELIKLALSRMDKQLRSLPTKGLLLSRVKKRALNKLDFLEAFFKKYLLSIIKKMPHLDTIHPFYRSIINIWSSVDDIKIELAKIYGAYKLILRFIDRYKEKIRRINPRVNYRDIKGQKKAIKEIRKIETECFGRIFSVIKSLKKEFRHLSDIVIKMKKLPDLDPSLPVVVVVGPPNAGKSSFVKLVSNARVEIASYPFTTKNITFGHLEKRENKLVLKRAQIVDTPGLFDKPLDGRKKEELLALNAIKYLANVVLFLFDGSSMAVMSPEEQLNVLSVVISFFGKNRAIILAINKVDIPKEEAIQKIKLELDRRYNTKPILISVKKQKNIDKIIELIWADLSK
ncbi:MAG: GTPase [Candidatus Njordarchaeum guaymaensis]